MVIKNGETRCMLCIDSDTGIDLVLTSLSHL